jgi:hypothetical protein
MPKWDKTRNYYADLELPLSASSDDIKKQFKKLGTTPVDQCYEHMRARIRNNC